MQIIQHWEMFGNRPLQRPKVAAVVSNSRRGDGIGDEAVRDERVVAGSGDV